MPTVLRIGPYRFFFVSLDRDEPPHIYAKRAYGGEILARSVALQQAGGFDRRDLNTIGRLVQEQGEILGGMV
jgi:Domain of unknown function (DUF4160)